MFPLAQKARGNDAGVVRNQQVSRLQIITELRHAAVRYLTCAPLVHEQPGGIARLTGMLRDIPWRQCVIEVFKSDHESSAIMRWAIPHSG